MLPPKHDFANNWLQKELKNYFNGQWQKSRSNDFFDLINPVNSKKLISYQMASQQDLDDAVTSAKECHEKGHWLTTNMREKARVMRSIGQLVREHHGELAILETLANGKTYKESYYDDIPDCADVFDYYAGWIDKHYGDTCPVEDGFLNYTLNEPMGVCALIVPWNFPLLMACWKIAPALATGNTVIVKPSEYTPLSLIRLFELIDENIDLPKGLLNLVIGDGRLGQMISEHSNIDKVGFTGSTETGKSIIQASGHSNLKHISLELGGKSPNIFFDDTPDLKTALDRSFDVMFGHKGEKCTEPTRFIIHNSLYDQAVKILVEKANKIRCGDPFDENTDQGPQCFQKHFEKVMDYIKIGQDEGAKLLCGGIQDTNGSNGAGYFIRPTIFGDVTSDMKIAQDEIFGPVLCLQRFNEDEEAIQIANNSRYGLASGLWTQNVSRAHFVAKKLDTGMVFINRYGCYDFTSPFGGFKQSGWGKDMARHSLDSYTKTKSIWLKVA